MPRIHHLLVCATICLTASANPLEKLAARGTFSLQQVAVEGAEPVSLAKVVARHYWKFGFDAPKAIEKLIRDEEAARTVNRVAEPAGSGSVTARPYENEKLYLIQMEVGKHTLKLDLDTGSADLWVLSTDLLPAFKVGLDRRRMYDTRGAQKLPGGHWNVSYGSGENVSGLVYYDKVRIGGLEVPKQAVQAAVNLTGKSVAKNPNMDGILGMGFSKLNQVRPRKQLTWFDNIRGKLDQPLFVSILKKGAMGSFDFGFLDRKKYTGEIAWQEVNSTRGFWSLDIDAFGVGNGSLTRVRTSSIVDTGSSLWFMPEALVREYYRKVRGARAPPYTGPQKRGTVVGYTFPCDAHLPDVELSIGGKRVSVPGRNINYQVTSRAMNICFGGLQPRAAYMPFNLFGDVFLKGMYVVFEHKPNGRPRIGVARGA